MNITWRLAWRNLWRHRRRTWLTVGAMVFCNTLLIFMLSLQLGSYDVMISNTLASFTGHLQVQHADYQQEQKMRQTVPDVAGMANRLRDALPTAQVAARASGFALASSDQRSFGIEVMGVQPRYEREVSNLPALVREGRYLSADDAAEIVVGGVLARNLQLGVGDELTFLGSGMDGSLAAGVVTVVGIIDSGITDLDRVLSQVPLAYFQDAFAMQGAGHSVVAVLPQLDDVPAAVAQLSPLLAGREPLVVKDWNTLEPGLEQAIRADLTSAWFMYGVLILLVALSVLNTQLMSVLERTREFGVMMALGTSPGLLSRLVAMETLIMAALGLFFGLLFGAMVNAYLSVAGFSYPGMEEMAAQFSIPGRIYPDTGLRGMLWGPSVVFAGAMLATIYPSLRLFRLEPVAAMRAI